jgi:polyhydroxyalkanoate synthesis repressor PhaR
MLVKKYSNRRLYDTEKSAYITLEELADRIRQGADARVVDAKTGDDLTQQTLAQIILESRGAGKLLPIPLLPQLIRMGDDALAEFMGKFLSTALELYMSAKQGAQTLAPINPFATLPFSATSALARLLSGGGLFEQTPPPPPPPTTAAAAQSSEISSLRRELDELKQAFLRKKK